MGPAVTRPSSAEEGGSPTYSPPPKKGSPIVWVRLSLWLEPPPPPFPEEGEWARDPKKMDYKEISK